MFSQALNLQKIYLVTSPISIYQYHFSGEGSLIENSLSSFEKLRFNFFEILLFIFCIGISWKSYPQNTMINITLFVMYILFKFIFSLKYGIYMDISIFYIVTNNLFKYTVFKIFQDKYINFFIIFKYIIKF